MSKRDKKMSALNTLNRLNEEDENALTAAEEEKRKLEEEKINSANEYALEKLKLKDTIDGVFKTLPYCEQASVNLNDTKRLQSLEQLLIDRLILNKFEPKVAPNYAHYLTPPEYGSYLSSHTFTQQTKVPSDTSLLDKEEHLALNKLNLNNECLSYFTVDKLIGLQSSEAGLGTSKT